MIYGGTRIMNKTAIKNFAIWARNKLIADISYRARLMGITEEGIAYALPQSTGDTEFYDIGAAKPYAITGDAIRQRKKLVKVIRTKEAETDYNTAYQYIIEEVTYTWFNRLIAVRFMEINDYLPSHIRVLSSESGKLEPDLVTTPFDAGLSFTAEEENELMQLKQDNKMDEAFRLLFIKQCNALNESLPILFEKTKDYTELLLNLSIVDQEGVVYHLVHDIPEDDFNVERGGQVEIIGWLYQYYNTEPKAAAFAKNGKIIKEEIPAVTQLFTPDWIVRYMVENSLGRLWLEGHPDSNLKENWKYYLDEAEQEPEVQVKLAEIRKEYAVLTPEDIKLIDPCMGSGHILVYAFDVLMQIYTSVGYSEREAARCILEHNIYGLDIDDRAQQLAYFAVMMKARQYNRRILNGENTCHVYSIQESNNVNRDHLKYFGAGLSDLEKNLAKMQIEGLLDTLIDAKEYGSILKVEDYNWELLRRFVTDLDVAGQISMDSFGIEDTLEQLLKLIDIGETMAQKYWVTVTNPPYMGSNNMPQNLFEFITKNYLSGKTDLFATFIEKCLDWVNYGGNVAMITQQGWMFLSSYEELRKKIQLQRTISLLQLGSRAFDEISGEVVQTCAFVINTIHANNYISSFSRLVDFLGEGGKEKAFFDQGNLYYKNAEMFNAIPGIPIAYWCSDQVLKIFRENQPLSSILTPRQGVKTLDNPRFLKLWYEVIYQKIGFHAQTLEEANAMNRKWFPYNKGGTAIKWYGNKDYIVNWENDGVEMKAFAIKKYNSVTRTITNISYFFLQGITWSDVSTGNIAVRFAQAGSMFDSTGIMAFGKEKDLQYIIALMNSKVMMLFLKILAPSLHFNGGAINNVPLIFERKEQEKIEQYSEKNEDIAKADWDSFETSWDFIEHPLVRLSKGLWDGTNVACMMDYYYGELPKASCPLEISWLLWQGECNERFKKLKSNEEELNRIFIDIYGLQDELTPEVEDKDVTVRKADLQRDIKSLLSYAIGCMFGRYSLDKEGLILAGQSFDTCFVQASNIAAGTSITGASSLHRQPGSLYLKTDNGLKKCSFEPDMDNVIPITDEEYLDDDIVTRLCGWLKVVYGEDTLEANLDFIAKALGNKGNTSREIIRNYFLNDFFKDHCQTYSVTGSGKRPIYWLFDSGKQNGFKALIYLHRYTSDTIGNLRVDYLHRIQRIYESEIDRMQDMIDHSTNARETSVAAKRKDKLTKQLKECRDYDEKIGHLALSRIEIDFDDGVKVNYRKLQTAYDGEFYEVLADSKNIMVKKK